MVGERGSDTLALLKMPESPAGYYTYQPPGTSRPIHLAHDAIDGILAEVLTGFGAIPRRGAEVGGLLLGKADEDAVWIEGFAMVACEHRRGPSFLLSDQDREAFAGTFRSNRTAEAAPVGLFRSNTRDGDLLSDEDRTLFHEYFPPPEGVFLVIRPYASKTSTAWFLTYQDGSLPDSNADTFPFLRREIEGGPSARRRPLGERRTRPAATAQDAVPVEAPVFAPSTATVVAEPESITLDGKLPEVRESLPEPVFAPRELEEAQRERRRSWLWIPLSFIFLLLGVLLGFQAALTLYPKQVTVDAAAFGLGLSASTKDENVHIKWNRESAAIRAAQRGTLEIRDGKYTKTVELDSGALQTGSVMYPPVSDNVDLRLQLTIRGSNVVSETLEWARAQR